MDAKAPATVEIVVSGQPIAVFEDLTLHISFDEDEPEDLEILDITVTGDDRQEISLRETPFFGWLRDAAYRDCRDDIEYAIADACVAAGIDPTENKY